MELKNKQIFLALGALLCVAVLLFLLIYFTGNAADDQPEPANETNVNQTQYQDNFTSNPLLSQADSQITADSQAPISSTLADGVMYVVKEYEGIIGVFLPGSDVPIQLLDVFVETLPASDRALLAKGISVTGKAALQSLLEDYGS